MEQEPHITNDTAPFSILYVDDEPGLLDLGRIFLERSGTCTVTTCEDAVDALRLLEEESFDAIISDYQMPGCDGILFLRHIRRHGDQTPFIIFTGKGREEVAIQALNEGADFYLQKGGEAKSQFAELQKKVEYAIEKHRAEAALAEREEQLRTLINAMPDIVCFKDDRGRWLEANAYGRDLFQLTDVDYVGKKDSELAVFSPRYADVFRACARYDEQAWAKGSALRYEANIPAHDGTTRLFDIIKVPIFNPDGSRKGLVVVGRDITERKAAEEAVRRRKDELERFEKAVIGRELKMIELKERIAELEGMVVSERDE